MTANEGPQSVITDEYMQEQLAGSAMYTLVLLTRTPERDKPGADEIVWEHGRRNFELSAAGKIAIVGPIPDETELAGAMIFAADLDETQQLMGDDPSIRAGIFTYQLHPLRSFPGSTLPPT